MAQNGDGWDDLFIYLLLLDDPSMHVNQHFQKWMSPVLVPDRGPGFQKYWTTNSPHWKHSLKKNLGCSPEKSLDPSRWKIFHKCQLCCDCPIHKTASILQQYCYYKYGDLQLRPSEVILPFLTPSKMPQCNNEPICLFFLPLMYAKVAKELLTIVPSFFGSLDSFGSISIPATRGGKANSVTL